MPRHKWGIVEGMGSGSEEKEEDQEGEEEEEEEEEVEVEEEEEEEEMEEDDMEDTCMPEKPVAWYVHHIWLLLVDELRSDLPRRVREAVEAAGAEYEKVGIDVFVLKDETDPNNRAKRDCASFESECNGDCDLAKPSAKQMRKLQLIQACKQEDAEPLCREAGLT